MASDSTAARVVSVNVGRPRAFEFNGKQVKSAIWKAPVEGRVAARGINLEGDDQADRKAHGGYDKAVYAYALEDLRWFERAEARAIPYGGFGENLTTEGIDVNAALVGERWEIGGAVLEVSEPRIPCWRLGVRMDDRRFIRRFTDAMRPGAYLRIVGEGELGMGDAIRVVEKPSHAVTIRDVFRVYTRDRHDIAKLLAVPQLSAAWRGWAEHMLEKQA